MAMSGLSEHVIYEICIPVTIKVQESAVVPIATLEPEGDRVLVFDPKETEVNAVKAIHLRNTTDMVLANGSVSILEGGRFMGQADFMPMLPGDDQLVPYDQDTSVSIVRSYPQELQSNEIERVAPIFEGDNCGRVTGASLVHKRVKTTRYTLKNNATDRTVRKFYIDHSADSAHGGYVITTDKDCVKAVTGWSRFECSLDPLEEKVFDVAEEASFSRRLTSSNAIDTFLKARDTVRLLEAGVLELELQASLKEVVRQEALKAIYAKVENHRVSERDCVDWQQEDILPTEVLALVQRVRAAEASLSEIERQKKTHKAHVEKVFANQERLRSNIQSLEKVKNTQLVERYLKDLNNEEDDLIETNTKLDALEDARVEADGVLRDLKLQASMEAAKLRAALDA